MNMKRVLGNTVALALAMVFVLTAFPARAGSTVTVSASWTNVNVVPYHLCNVQTQSYQGWTWNSAGYYYKSVHFASYASIAFTEQYFLYADGWADMAYIDHTIYQFNPRNGWIQYGHDQVSTGSDVYGYMTSSSFYIGFNTWRDVVHAWGVDSGNVVCSTTVDFRVLNS